ncbi:MAG: Dam family site-specific DNA-(adenine-N6)-methyltransferase [Candidatus Methanoplasma sp.]|jgi:DNA adenine methylase|nr:Dam family site-specific DNA-(adenine-N6)-methyltransferase [Candidatus Methanoplasma sp.]
MIKYRGGKSREIKAFSGFCPDSFDTYFEPFLGGGALFFRLEPERAVVSDANARLMGFYSDVRDRFDEIRGQLDSVQKRYCENMAGYLRLKEGSPGERAPNANEDMYYEMRSMYNGSVPSRYLDGALYYFINKTSYSGMIRHNSRGEYNVPFGHYPNFSAEAVTRAHSDLLKRAELRCGDYSEVFGMAGEGDFMFLDPPYDCVFRDYGNAGSAGGFGEAEHRRLARDFRRLRCKALMVIGKTPLTEELYGEFVKGEYGKSYAVNIRNRFRSGATHLIVTNY